MASVFHRTDGRFLASVHTPNYDAANWIINPDLSAVTNEPVRYWIIDPPGSDTIRAATAAEKLSIDAAIASDRDDAEKAGAKNQVDVERVVRALVDMLPGEFNILRSLHSLADRTPAQLRAALKAHIDAQ